MLSLVERQCRKIDTMTTEPTTILLSVAFPLLPNSWSMFGSGFFSGLTTASQIMSQVMTEMDIEELFAGRLKQIHTRVIQTGVKSLSTVL